MPTQTFHWQRELRQIAIIALPIIAAQLLQMGMGVIDTVMAGRISPLALASVALGASLWSLVVLGGVGLMVALTPILSQHLGANQPAKIREELRQGVWLALILGIILMVFLALLAQLMPLLGIKPALIPAVEQYLWWVSWSLPFSCLYLVPRTFNESMGFTMPMLWIQLLLLPLNALGNYLFMFGQGGFPAMGAAGAALATGIAQTIGCILLYAYTLRARRYQPYDLARRMTWPDWAHIGQIVRLGLPISIGVTMEVGMFTTIALLMGRLSVEAAAGHQIALNIASATFMVPLGTSLALTVRVGHAIGGQNYRLAQQRGRLGIMLCAGFMALSGLMLWLYGAVLAALYTDNAAVAAVATHLLVFAAIFQFWDGLQVGAIGVLRGYKDTKIPMYMSVFCYWVIGVGTSVYLSVYGDHGAEGLWIGLVAGLLVAALVLNARVQWLSERALKTEGREQPTGKVI